MVARWLGTLVEISRNLLEKKGNDFTAEILERFDNRG